MFGHSEANCGAHVPDETHMDARTHMRSQDGQDARMQWKKGGVERTENVCDQERETCLLLCFP